MKTSNLYPPTSDPRPPMVSVVVTTKNEERNIEHCMKSIKLQSYENIEIIVVDNFSADKTKEIALKYTNKVYDKGPERSAQRNFGMIDMAKGKYVMFVDADMILSPCLVESCVEEMEEDWQTSDLKPLTSNLKPQAFATKVLVALHIPEIVLGKKYFSKVRRFERSFYDGTVIDGARFFLKEAFVKTGGFDENLTGPEDWDLDKKLKDIGKIELIITPIYHNEAEFSLRKYLKKKAYYMDKFGNYIAKWGADDPDLKKQLGIYYRFIGVFVEKGKWKLLILHPVLTLGMLTLRFLVGTKFLLVKRHLKTM